MSLWSLFIALTALAVALSMRAAVFAPRGRVPVQDARDQDPKEDSPPDLRGDVRDLRLRIEALESDVDDLNRLTTNLREENEYLQQRLDAGQGGLDAGGTR